MCVLTFYIHLVFLWPSTWHFVQVLGSFKSLCSIVSCLLIASLNSEIPKESSRPLPPPPQQPPLPAHPPSKPPGPQPSFEPPTRQPAVPRLRPQAPPPQPPPQHPPPILQAHPKKKARLPSPLKAPLKAVPFKAMPVPCKPFSFFLTFKRGALLLCVFLYTISIMPKTGWSWPSNHCYSGVCWLFIFTLFSYGLVHGILFKCLVPLSLYVQ